MATRIRRTTKPTYSRGTVGAITAPVRTAAPLPSTPGQPAGPPLDPQWIQQQAAAQRGLDLGSAWDTYATGQLEQQYGFNNSSDPYSVAMRLQDAYQSQQRGTTNSLAAQGQLYSGALQNQRNADAKGYAQSYHDAYQQYQGAKDQITRGAIDRVSNTVGNVSQDQINMILRQLGLL